MRIGIGTALLQAEVALPHMPARHSLCNTGSEYFYSNEFLVSLRLESGLQLRGGGEVGNSFWLIYKRDWLNLRERY